MAFEGQVTVVDNKRVYVVSTGSYDSYRVLCAAPNKKTADEFVEKAGKSYRVEHIPIYNEYSETTEYPTQLEVSFDIGVEQEDAHQVSRPMFDEQQRLKPLMSYSKYTRYSRGYAIGYVIKTCGTDKELVRDAAYAIKDILKDNPEVRHRATSAWQPKFNAWKKERGIK